MNSTRLHIWGLLILAGALIPQVNYAQGHSDSSTVSSLIARDLTKSQFDSITSSQTLVLVHFSADWCIVCKRQKPILDAIVAERNGRLGFLEVDMEHNPLIAEYYEVDGLPVLILFRKGQMTWNRMGFQDKNRILEQIRLYE